jgi:hypothetical protein
MPDFDTRKPQEPNEPNRARIQVVANKLHTLLIAIRPRMQLIANRLRSLLIASKRRSLSRVNTLRGSLMANRLRTLLIAGVLLLVTVAVPVGMLIYPSGGFDHPLQIGSQQDEGIIPGMQKPLMENIRIDENLKGKLVFQLSGTYKTPPRMRSRS